MFIFSDTHALVDFLEEDATAIVPISHLKKKENLEHGGSCLVLWSEKVYKAFLICSGLYNLFHMLHFASVSIFRAKSFSSVDFLWRRFITVLNCAYCIIQLCNCASELHMYDD